MSLVKMKTCYALLFVGLSFLSTLPALLAQGESLGGDFALKGNSFGPGWKVDVEQGCEVTLDDGQIKIKAPINSFAHAQIPLDNFNNLRVTCDISSGGGVSWAPGLCLYWDEDNWFLVHLFEGVGLYGTECVDGQIRESNFSTRKVNECNTVEISDLWQYHEVNSCLALVMDIPPLHQWVGVGLELTQDDIYYISNVIGERWQFERAVSRSGVTAAPPALLVLGKGYSQKGKYPNPDMNNSFGSGADAITESGIRNLKVEKDIVSIVKSQAESQKQLGEDVDGKMILAQGEPTFDRVAALYPPVQYMRESFGVKEHPNVFMTTPEGSIQAGAYVVSHFNFGNEKARFGRMPQFPTKKLEDGYLPVIEAHWSYHSLLCTQRAFAWSDLMSPDTSTYAYVSMQIENPTNESVEIRLGYQKVAGEELLNWTKKIEAGKSTTIYLEIPWDTDSLKEIDAKTYNKLHKETVDFWAGLLNSGMKINVPEQRINDAYRIWLAYNFMNVDKIDDRFEIHDGSNFYEEIYGYSAALAIEAFDWMGFQKDAQKYLESLLPFVSQDGLFILNYGLPDQGALLIAIANHFDMTQDTQWLKKMAPTMIKMANWVRSKREDVKLSQDKNGPLYGLIKMRPYCDNSKPAYYYVSDVTITVGLEMTAEAFKKIGLDDEARWIAEEAVDYRRCVMDSMEKSVIIRDGFELLPMFPETHELLLAADYSATDYYSLTLGTLLEINSLPTDSRFAKIYVNALENKGGLALGVARFNGGIDHAYTYGYWMYCLGRDEIDKVLLGLYTSMAYGMTRDTYSACEVTWHKTGKNPQSLPHTYSNTQQLRLIRNMLLREEGNRLLLGQAIPRAWLEEGKEITVADAPTRFGDVSYSIQSQIDSDKITASIAPPAKFPAESIAIRLRHPAEKPIKKVNLQGQGTAQIEGDWIILTNLAGPVTLEAGY